MAAKMVAATAGGEASVTVLGSRACNAGNQITITHLRNFECKPFVRRMSTQRLTVVRQAEQGLLWWCALAAAVEITARVLLRGPLSAYHPWSSRDDAV